VKRFDSIAVLDNGVVAEQGTYDELIAAGGLFCRMMEEPEALK
jgi:ABC-type multidrug transport system fused ATPase/permease subunit